MSGKTCSKQSKQDASACVCNLLNKDVIADIWAQRQEEGHWCKQEDGCQSSRQLWQHSAETDSMPNSASKQASRQSTSLCTPWTKHCTLFLRTILQHIHPATYIANITHIFTFIKNVACRNSLESSFEPVLSIIVKHAPLYTGASMMIMAWPRCWRADL